MFAYLISLPTRFYFYIKLTTLPLKISAALACLFIFLSGCAHQLPTGSSSAPFTWSTDRFSFANETVWIYDAPPVLNKADSDQKAQTYSRRCFVMARAALQFRKFARFDPTLAPISGLELSKRIRQVSSKPVWEEELSYDKKIVFPASKNLFNFSQQHQSLLQKNIGAGWPIYFRLGNMAMPFPVSRAHQARTADELRQMIQNKQPAVLWLTRFPSLAINHTVLVYALRQNEAVWEFEVYDPNYTDGPKRLNYDPQTNVFSYQKTFYFKGGPITARTVYWSHLQ
ncbi:MAG: hypothetical protein SH807_10410 [Blastochloris sp.]|nr:hypothetical protein [Blastochloris sp.]